MLHFSYQKEMKLWSDFLQIQAKKSLKKLLDFSDEKGLQPSLDFLKFKVKKHRNNGWISQIKNDCYYGQIAIKFKQKNH